MRIAKTRRLCGRRRGRFYLAEEARSGELINRDANQRVIRYSVIG
jgi:hypothetical protein